MATMALFLALLLALTGYSSATYCVCKDGADTAAMQKTIDYACGAGADCSAILEKGGCFNPNTVKAHCDFAANSYFQRKGQVSGSCDFSGTATVTNSLPSGSVGTGCTFPASPSQTGTSTSTTTGTTTTGGTSTGTTSGMYGGGNLGPTGIMDANPNGSLATLHSPGRLGLVLFFSALLVAL